jgi:hypothetical protein
MEVIEEKVEAASKEIRRETEAQPEADQSDRSRLGFAAKLEGNERRQEKNESAPRSIRKGIRKQPKLNDEARMTNE